VWAHRALNSSNRRFPAPLPGSRDPYDVPESPAGASKYDVEWAQLGDPMGFEAPRASLPSRRPLLYFVRINTN
jgi:hypothetical protein